MATKKKSEETSEFVELVSPDGERKVTPTNRATDVQLRFQGYLPSQQQKLEAPARSDSGSSTLPGGAEKTAGSNG